MIGEIRLAFDGSGADKAESKLKSVGGSMQKVGTMATVGLSAPIAAGFGVAVNEAASFEEAMVGVEKVTNPEVAERMGEAIKGMAAEMPLAHEELATIAETAGQLGVGEEHLESFTESVAKMSVATDLTAQEAADSFARISTLMRLPMEDAEELGSAINELSNNFGASASEITDVMTRAGGAFHALGLGEDQALGLAAAMNEVSPSSRLAAGGLKRISEMLMDPKKVNQIADAFGMTSGELQKMIDNDPSGVMEMLAKEMQTGSQTSKQLRSDLGKQASELTTLGSNWDAVEQATKDAAGQFENATSLQEEFDAASSSVSSQLQITKNQFKNVAIAIGDALLPYIRALNDILSSVAKRLMGMSDAQRTALITVAALVAAIGPLIFAVGTILTLIPSMAAGWAAVTAALSGGLIPALAGAASTIAGTLAPAIGVLLGPIGIIIGAIALLAAAWATNFGGIRGQTMRVVGVLRDELAPAFNWLRNIASQLLSYLGENGPSTFAALSESAKPLVSAIADGLIWGIRALAAAARTVFPYLVSAWGLLQQAVTSAISVIRPRIESFLAWFSVVWKQSVYPVVQQAKLTWAVLQQDITAFVAWARPYVRTFMGALVSFVSWGLTKIQDFWSVWGGPIMNTLRQFGQSALLIIEQVMDFISTAISVGLAVMRGDWSTAWSLVEGFLRRTVFRIRKFVSGWVRVLIGNIKTLVTTVIGWFQRLYQRLVGGSIIPNLVNRSISLFSNLDTRVRSIISGWVSNLIGLFGRLRAQAVGRAQQLRAQFVRQVARLKARAQQQVDSMVDNLVSIIRNKISDFKSAGKALVRGFTDGIKSLKNAPKNAAKKLVGKVRNLFPGSDAKEGPLSDISKTGPALVETFAAGIASKADLAASAAETVAQAAKRPLENMSLQDMVSNLSHGQRMDLSHVLEDTGFVDKYYKASAMLRKFGEGGAVSGLSTALSGGKAGRALRRMARNGPRDEGPMVRAEDGSMVPASYYDKRAKPARHERKRAEPERVKIDFGDLDDDDYVSVGALKKELKEYVKKREHDAVKRATDGDFTI